MVIYKSFFAPLGDNTFYAFLLHLSDKFWAVIRTSFKAEFSHLGPMCLYEVNEIVTHITLYYYLIITCYWATTWEMWGSNTRWCVWLQSFITFLTSVTYTTHWPEVREFCFKTSANHCSKLVTQVEEECIERVVTKRSKKWLVYHHFKQYLVIQ